MPNISACISTRQLNWKKYICSKRKHLGLKLNKMYWLLDRNSQPTLENKILLYKTKTHLNVWSNSGQSQIPTLRYCNQRYESKILKIMLPGINDTLHRDLKTPTIEETIKEFRQRYHDRLEEHPNKLAAKLMKARGIMRRLKRKRPIDLLN